MHDPAPATSQVAHAADGLLLPNIVSPPCSPQPPLGEKQKQGTGQLPLWSCERAEQAHLIADAKLTAGSFPGNLTSPQNGQAVTVGKGSVTDSHWGAVNQIHSTTVEGTK